MGPLALSELATRQADWLQSRQKVIAENIANSDTPGYRAMDVSSFAKTLERSNLAMSVTAPGHMAAESFTSANPGKSSARPWDIVHSGNSVSLDQQLLKANEVRSAYSLNVGIVRAFGRMMLASVKG